jgi:hypothetical protein
MRLIAEAGGKSDIGDRPIPDRQTRACPFEANVAHKLSDTYSERGAEFLAQVNRMHALIRG